MINNLCILDKPNKTWMQSNFIPIDINELPVCNIPYGNIYALYIACLNVDLLYPTIKISDIMVTLKYDYGNYYIKLFINKDSKDISFIYGIVNKKPRSGIIIDLDKQLNALSNFLYTNQLKVKING